MRVTIKVFLLDDHEIVRRGLTELLELSGDITVVGESGSAAEAIRRIPALRPDVAVLDAGTYDVVVTNSAGSVPSTAVPLVVNVPPAIATQPVNLGAGAGTGVVFSVTATGTAPLTYQWSKDGSPLSGATLATLSLANVSSATAGT